MFKAIITEKDTTIIGDTAEGLAGLMCYIDALYEMQIPTDAIKETIKMVIKDNENKKVKVETIVDDEHVKIQKFDLNNLTEEEAKRLVGKELEKMFRRK